MRNVLRKDPDPTVREYATHWEVTIPFGLISPKATIWTTDVLFIGSECNTKIELPFEIYASNLPSPQTQPLVVEIVADVHEMTRADLPARALD